MRRVGDPSADIDAHAGSLDGLLELARIDEENGLPDAPWPPNFKKMPGEAHARAAEPRPPGMSEPTQPVSASARRRRTAR